MRIFIIHNFYQHQGGEDIVFRNEVQLLSNDHEVKTYTSKNLKGWNGLKQFSLYPWNMWEARRILKEIKHFQPDVVHIHNMHYAIGPYIIRKIKNAGYPVLMTLHNYRLICPSATLFHDGQLFTDSIQQDFPWSAIRRKVLDNSFFKTLYTGCTYYIHRKIGTFAMVDRFILLSQFAKDILVISKLDLPEYKFFVKPNFVPQPRIENREPEKYFMYIGRFSEEKGIVPLLKNIAGTAFRLKVFGTGPQEELVLSIINQHDNLEYGGYLPHEDLLQQLAAAEALIVPSICYEGMPMTILDSFALGIPVIASRIGILAEMVVPLYSGDLYDPFDPHAIQHVLIKWNQISEDQKEQIRTNCQNEYAEKYTSERNKILLEKVYIEAIAQNR